MCEVYIKWFSVWYNKDLWINHWKKEIKVKGKESRKIWLHSCNISSWKKWFIFTVSLYMHVLKETCWIFESKRLQCPAFPFISCFQFLKREKPQEYRPDPETPVTQFWARPVKTNSPSSLPAVNETPQQLSSSQRDTCLPPALLTVGDFKCYRSAAAVPSSHTYTHTNLASCHLLPPLCQGTPAKHKHFQVPDNMWLRRSMPLREKKKKWPRKY